MQRTHYNDTQRDYLIQIISTLNTPDQVTNFDLGALYAISMINDHFNLELDALLKFFGDYRTNIKNTQKLLRGQNV